jgi:DNA-binding response OmpR family regulator
LSSYSEHKPMGLRSLLLCSDEKVVRVVRRILGDLEIAVEHCTDTDAAIRKLTRERFEAVVVDCSNENSAAEVLKSARSAPSNKHAIAIAIIDSQQTVRGVFGIGAHFAVYKPISAERAKASFRAARALMKSERRRNTRVAVEFPVTLIMQDKSSETQAVTSDVSEGGMAIQVAQRPPRAKSIRVRFTLPATDTAIESAAELAWQGTGSQAGLRFVDLPLNQRDMLRAWLARHSAEIEPDDPPAPAKITDLSMGACYLEMPAPFPPRSRVTLSNKVAEATAKADGIVRVMHPDLGMGVEFRRSTPSETEQVEKLINHLVNAGATPELYVQPQGMEDGPVTYQTMTSRGDDPLLYLFQNKGQLDTDTFLAEMRQQRAVP